MPDGENIGNLSPRHAEARRLALAGVPVIPLAVGGKAANVTPHGFEDETTDLAQIDAWWGQADYNLGVRPVHLGLIALDLDLYKKGGVSQAIRELLPPTRKHASP